MAWRFTCVALALTVVAANVKKESNYPNDQMLIEARALARPEGLKHYRIVDTRSLKKFKAEHILHASWVNVAAWNKTFNIRPDKETWSSLIGALGIDTDTPVVVYGDDLRETARIWWILRYWSVPDVRILNGGWMAWKNVSGAVTSNRSEPMVEPKKPSLHPMTGRLAVKDELLRALEKKTFQIADARSEKEFCGEARTARRNGSIPGAKHLEWSDLIDPKTQRFRTPAELKALLSRAGIDVEKPTVTYCQSGGRAAALAFALELMGGKDVRNYYRSWAEWGNDESTPVARPKK